VWISRQPQRRAVWACSSAESPLPHPPYGLAAIPVRRQRPGIDEPAALAHHGPADRLRRGDACGIVHHLDIDGHPAQHADGLADVLGQHQWADFIHRDACLQAGSDYR